MFRGIDRKYDVIDLLVISPSDDKMTISSEGLRIIPATLRLPSLSVVTIKKRVFAPIDDQIKKL